MKKFYLYRDERWPDYGLSDTKTSEGKTVELSAEDEADFQKACDHYEAWQARLGKAFNS